MSISEVHARDILAAQSFRETGDRSHLDQLRRDGERVIAHHLTMERVYGAGTPEAKEHTDQIDAWLATS